jgi:oligoribonuclease NrnB/cAMP/cGMP phosphodiesterase (DHH superfamily)
MLNIPIVWIDHHEVPIEKYAYKNLFYYNPIHGKKKSAESTTHLCYSVTKREEDYWIALIGCIADHYLPDDFTKFSDLYPEMWGKNIIEPFQALYTTGVGRIARALSFGLKDSISHVVQLQNMFIASKDPHDIEKELEGKSAFALKYKEILEKYNSLLDDAKKSYDGSNLLFFNYGGNMSISSDLSNQLSYLFAGKYICVSYTLGPYTNVSFRGEGVSKILEKIILEFQDARGGGHANAVGVRIRTEDIDRFKQRILEIVK